MNRTLTSSVTLLLVIGLVMATPGSLTTPPLEESLQSVDEDQLGFSAAMTDHEDKLPAGYESWLQYALPDGSLRVTVAMEDRTAAAEAFVQRNTLTHEWFPHLPHFMALVTPDQVATVLADDRVVLVTPDHPLEYFTAQSSVNTNARSVDGAGTGAWTFMSPLGSSGSAAFGANQFPGALATDHPDFTGAVTGGGVTVAVVDSGIDATHRDFSGWSCSAEPYAPCNSRIVENVKTEMLIGTNFGYDATSPTTDLASGHGTHVSGTIAGNGYVSREGGNHPSHGGDRLVFGVAPESELVVVSNGDTLWAGLADWAFAHIYDEKVFRNSPHFADVKVISNSWGCLGGCAYNPANTVMAYSKLFYDQGVVVVFAAGNDGCGNTLSGYAANPFVLGVASYNDHGNSPSSFSSCGNVNTLPAASGWDPYTEFAPGNYGPLNHLRRPDIAAPGEDIIAARSLTGGAASGIPRVSTSDVLGGAWSGISYYAPMSGTSMATPHVAGVAALLFDACPAASPLEVMRAIIASAANPPGSAVASAPAKQVGYGILDAAAAVAWIDDNAVAACTGP